MNDICCHPCFGTRKSRTRENQDGDDRLLLLSVRGGINYTRTYTRGSGARKNGTAQSVTRALRYEWGGGGGGGGATNGQLLRAYDGQERTQALVAGRRAEGELENAPRRRERRVRFFYYLPSAAPPVHTAVRPVGGTPLCVSAAAIVCAARARAGACACVYAAARDVTRRRRPKRPYRGAANRTVRQRHNVREVRTPTACDARRRSVKSFPINFRKNRHGAHMMGGGGRQD